MTATASGEGDAEERESDTKWWCKYDADDEEWDDWWYYCEHHDPNWYCTDVFGQSELRALGRRELVVN